MNTNSTNYRLAAGALLFVGAAQFVIGMHLAEALYPGYNVSRDYISDLGAACNAFCVVQQPSAHIFNTSVFILGIFIIIGSYFIRREFHTPVVSLFFGLAGIGVVGVGLFTEAAGMIHGILSLIAFVFGGLSAIASYKLVKAPFSYFSVIMGITSLVAIVLLLLGLHLGLGPEVYLGKGGMERMIAYPVLLWLVGFGGYLMSVQKI